MRKLIKTRPRRQRKLEKMQIQKKSLVKSFRSALGESGVRDLSAFEKEIDNETTTVKSLKDAAKDVADAQKAIVDVDTELGALAKDTDTQKRKLREGMGQCACCRFTNMRANLRFTHPHRKYAQVTANMSKPYLQAQLTILTNGPAVLLPQT